MLNNHVNLWVFNLQISLSGLSQFPLTEISDEANDALLKKLCDLNSVTKALKNELVTLAKPSALFNEVISGFASNTNRLGTKQSKVENNASESAIVKTQSDNEKNFAFIKARSMKNLLLKKVCRPSDHANPTNQHLWQKRF